MLMREVIFICDNYIRIHMRSLLTLMTMGIAILSIVNIIFLPYEYIIERKSTITDHRKIKKYSQNIENKCDEYSYNVLFRASSLNIKTSRNASRKSSMQPISLFRKSSTQSFCNNSLIWNNDGFIVLKYLIINPKMSKFSDVKGGEKLQNVLGQNEATEKFSVVYGYFQLQCHTRRRITYHNEGFIKTGLQVLQFINATRKYGHRIGSRDLTIMVERGEYSNLFHTITEWFNVYIAMMKIKSQVKVNRVKILFMDKHPESSLDQVWSALFGKTEYADRLTEPKIFPYAVWLNSGHESLLNRHSLPSISQLADFRMFILAQYGFSDNKLVSCYNINITFIWRRDYVAHARNPRGIIQRKIANEKELLNETRRIFPFITVQGFQMESLSFSEQLKVITGTSILIGMHGAGLSHTLFLPKSAGLLELYPKYLDTGNKHFRALARWRNVHYMAWRNYHPKYEFEGYNTYIPPSVVIRYIKSLYIKMCSKNK